MSGDRDLVTVERFFDSTAVSLAKARLEGSGIRCHVANAVSSGLRDALGAAELQVSRADRARAKFILADMGAVVPTNRDAADGPVCSNCQGQYAYLQTGAAGAVVSLLTGREAAKQWECRKCGHRWEP